MIRAPNREIILATGAALLLHMLLFAAVQPTSDRAIDRPSVPPRTRYLPASAEDTAVADSTVRTVRSPVMFSLPSSMGFSQELVDNDVKTKLSFLQPVKTEHFLEGATSSRYSDVQLAPLDLMVSKGDKGPPLPFVFADAEPPRLVATRVALAAELKSRLVGGIVLPPQLNREVETPWEVHASISVSEQGAVRHILLEQPLESPERNQQVLQLLYSLRFKAGEPMEGSIDIYSPELDGGRIQ